MYFVFLMKSIIQNKNNLFQSKTLRGIRKNAGEKLSNLYVKDIEYRSQDARSRYFGAQRAMTETC